MTDKTEANYLFPYISIARLFIFIFLEQHKLRISNAKKKKSGCLSLGSIPFHFTS